MASSELLALVGNEPCCQYYRLSEHDDAKVNGIETQRSFIGKLARRHRLNVVAEVEDNGQDSEWGLLRRQGAREMMTLAREGRIKWVIVNFYDRLGRDMPLLENIFGLLAFGVRVISVHDGFNPYTDTGRLLLFVTAGVSGLQRRTTQTLTANKQHAAVEHGQWQNGVTPYGFRRCPDLGGIVPDERPLRDCPGWSEAAVVRRIYELMVGNGWGGGRIAHWLDQQGIPVRIRYHEGVRRRARKEEHEVQGARWAGPEILRMVRNPVYKGERTHGVDRREKHEELGLLTVPCPPLVTPATWDAAQAGVRRRDRPKGASGRDYLLSGLVICSCGRHMNGAQLGTLAKGDRTHYYRCTSQSSTPPEGGRCPLPMARADWLEERVWADIAGWLHEPERVLDRLRAALDEDLARAGDYRAELDRLVRDRAGIKAGRAKLNARHAVGALTEEDLDAALAVLDDDERPLLVREEELRSRLAGCEAQATQVAAAERTIARVRGELAGGVDAALRRSIIWRVVARIHVAKRPVVKRGEPKHRVTPYYRFDEGLADAHALSEHTGTRTLIKGIALPLPDAA